MVYAYIRVSTEMQSYDSQEYEIIQFCKAKGITVDKWVLESVSGTTAVEKRTLGKTFRRMKQGDMLLCTEISRLGRNMLMIMSILNFCSSRGIRIRTVKDGFELSDNINSKIIAFAFALAAEIERNLISQRTKEAFALKRASGIRLGRPKGHSKKKESASRRWDEISAMIDKGIPMSQIARCVGVHRNTLRKYIERFSKDE